MGDNNKSKEQLAEELSQARRRIAEMEAILLDSGKLAVNYDTLRTFFDSATDSFSIWDSNLNLTYINDATLKYHPAGTKKSDVIGKNIKELIPDVEKSGRYEKYKHVLETGEPLLIEDFKADSKYGDIYLSIKVFKVGDGIGIASSDITERKRMERELQDSQQRLSALIDNVPDTIFSYDGDGRFISVNRRGEELLGYPETEIIGKTFGELALFTPVSLAKAKQRVADYKQGHLLEAMPYELIAKDGSHVFVEVRGVPIVQDEKVEVVAIARDITERRKMEDALRQSEEKLRAIISSIGDSITVVDRDGIITEVNDAAISLFGCESREKALGTQALSFISIEDQASATAKLRDGKPERFTEYKYKRLDGSNFWGETSSDVLYDASGNITGFIGIVRDITERRKMEDALRQSEERYRRLAEDMPALVCTFLPDSTLTYVNKAYSEYFRKPAEELLGTRFLNFIPDNEERRKVIGHYASLSSDNPVVTYEHTVEAPDGTRRWQQWTDRALFNDTGEITGYQSIGFDITGHKKKDEDLRQSEEKFRVIFNSIADGISVIDLTTGKVIDTNEAALRMFNFTREDVIGMPAYELIAEKDRQRAMEDLVNTLQTGDSGLAEWCLLGKGGTKHDCEARASVIRDASWNPLYLVNVIRDISARKSMEEKLRQSEEKLRAIFESIGDGVSIINMQGKVVEVNETALRTSGYSKEEFLSRNGLELIAERDRARAYDEMYKAFEMGYTRPTEFAIVRKDGTEYPGEATSTILRDNSGNPIGLVSVLRDITERKQLEVKLIQSEEKIRHVFNSVGVGITVTDMEGKVVEINDIGLQLCGYKKNELLGKNGINLIAERDRPRIINAMIAAFQTGKSSLQEFTALKKDGVEYDVEAIATVLSDASGDSTGMIISITDISERKRIERELNDYKENLERMVEIRTRELSDAYVELKHNEAALKESEEKYRTLVEQLPQGIVIMQDNRIVFANDAMSRINGHSLTEMLSMSPEKVVNIAHTESRADLSKRIDERMKGILVPQHSEWRIVRKDGTERWLEAQATRIIFNGKYAIQATLTDITERKCMEEALKSSEDKLRAMFASMADSVVVVGLDGKVKEVNDASLRLFEYVCKEDAMGKDGFTNFVLEEDRDSALQDMSCLLRERIPEERIFRLVSEKGREFTAEIHTSLISDSSGTPTDIMCVIRDITERKRMEEALRASEEKLRTMFLSMADGIVVTDLEGKVKDANTVMLNMFGFNEKEEILGLNGFDFIVDKDRDIAMSDIPQLFSDGIVTGRSWRFKHSSGREFQAELSTALIKDAEGNPSDILVVMRDITERKRMEEALRASEEKLRAIYDSIGDGITVTDLKGNIMDLNEAGLRFSGYDDKEEAIGRNGLMFIAKVDRDRARNDMLNVLQRGIGITTEYRLVDKGGREFDGEVSGAMICDTEGKPSAIVNVIRDITERKRIEQALMESEAKYRTLVEQSEQGICILQDGRIAFANNALSKINGYSLKEMYTMSPDVLLRTVHPDDREAFIERVKRRMRGDKMMPRHEYRIIRKDGAERTLETYTKRITYNGKLAIQSTMVDITERKQWEDKLQKSKEEMRFYLNQITKAQEEERKRIARELHDDTIQDLITLSRQLGDLVDTGISSAEDRRASRKKIEEAQNKVTAILQGIRSFTRELRPSILDDLGLVPALEWLAADMSSRFGIPVSISLIGKERSIPPDAALVVFRIAQESLRNAGQHSKASQIQLNLKFTARTVTLSIIDNGKGFILPKQISRLTKLGKLGVAGMQERAQLVGASLSIRSKRNSGTTVTLDVPVEKPS